MDADLDRIGPKSRADRGRRTWIVLGVVVGVLALAAFGLVRSVGSAREAARRSQCVCNLCQIKLALFNYESTYGSFPPAYVADGAGRRLHSWRVLVLPFMEQQALYNAYRFSEPWDGPNNRKLLEKRPTVFGCPSAFGHDHPEALTSYVVLTGPGTIFPGPGVTKLAQITDGRATTLLVAEVHDVEIPWTAPRDLDVRAMSFRLNDPERPGIGSPHPGGANVVFADGTTSFLRDATAAEDLRAMTTIAGGERLPARSPD